MSPILYYPRLNSHHLHQYVRNSFEDYIYKKDASKMKFLGYAKPFKKFDEKGYATNKRKENYIEREWRKIYITQWIDSQATMNEYKEQHRNKASTENPSCFRKRGRWICEMVSISRDFPAKVWPMAFPNCRRPR